MGQTFKFAGIFVPFGIILNLSLPSITAKSRGNRRHKYKIITWKGYKGHISKDGVYGMLAFSFEISTFIMAFQLYACTALLSLLSCMLSCYAKLQYYKRYGRHYISKWSKKRRISSFIAYKCFVLSLWKTEYVWFCTVLLNFSLILIRNAKFHIYAI